MENLISKKMIFFVLMAILFTACEKQEIKPEEGRVKVCMEGTCYNLFPGREITAKN